MRKLYSLILLLLLIPILLQAQYKSWKGWNGWRNSWVETSAGLIPTMNGALKLLVDPERQILTPNDEVLTQLNLGSNIVTNGDFHDFTFDVDMNTIALWIFDDVYHSQENTGKTVIQDLAGTHDLSIAGWTDYNDLLTDMTGSDPAYQGGKALNFPGVNERLIINSGDFQKIIGTTIELLYKPNTLTGLNPIVYNFNIGGTTIASIYIYQNANDLKIDIYNGSWVSKAITNIFTDTTTSHFIGIVVQDQNTILLYIDGVLNSTLDYTATPIIDPVGGTQYFVVGNNNGSLFLNGQIAAIRHSNKARTAQEIKESYGRAKGWIWDGIGSVSNSNFSQVVSGGGTITQTVSTSTGNLYKKEITTDGSKSISYVNETNHMISLGNGTHDNISIRPVLNANQIPNFVEDFSQGGAKYIQITVGNQGTQSTSQIYANSTKTTYYWGDGVSQEVIGDYRVTNGNHGLTAGSLEADQPQHPAALKFDGIDDYVDFGDVADVGTNDFIVFAWIKSNDLSIDTRIFAKRQINSLDIFYNTTTGYPGIYLSDGTNIVWNFNGVTKSIADGNWHFTVWILDRGVKVVRAITDLNPNGEKSYTTLGSLSDPVSLYMARHNTSYGKLEIGIAGIYIFDGQNGTPSSLPADYEQSIIKTIYNNTKDIYLNRGFFADVIRFIENLSPYLEFLRYKGAA